uniref:Tubulin polyglutamylase ttll6 n=1 Tax=Cacopsylla melanoneura TaxID=428564 RepID=A0A8D9BIF1_9HEMI
MRHNYRTACFQLLGFDILLDDQLRPFVIEVNHSPSFHTDSSLDLEVKEQVLRDTFLLCNLTNSIRGKIQKEERLEAQRRLTKRIGEKMGSRVWSEGKKSQQWTWEKGHMGRYTHFL